MKALELQLEYKFGIPNTPKDEAGKQRINTRECFKRENAKEFFQNVWEQVRANSKGFDNERLKREEIADSENHIKKFRRNTHFYILLDGYIQFLNTYQLKDTKKRPHTYMWQGDKKELIELLKGLKANRLIHSDTTQTAFLRAFQGQEIDDNFTKLKWIGAQALLAYFLAKANETGRFALEEDIWSKAEICFEGVKRVNIKSAYTRYRANKNPKHKGKPKNFQIIDSLLNK